MSRMTAVIVASDKISLSCCESSADERTSRVLLLNNDSSTQSICIINIDFLDRITSHIFGSQILCRRLSENSQGRIIKDWKKRSEELHNLADSCDSSTRSLEEQWTDLIRVLHTYVWSCWHLTARIHMSDLIREVIKSLPMSTNRTNFSALISPSSSLFLLSLE